MGLTYFISDLHLGARYIKDPMAHQRSVVSWLRSIAPTADRLYLLGDVLDYWYEYKTVVPRGYTRFLGALAELSDAGVKITWFKGNHDIWIYGYLQQELGIRVVDGSIVEEIEGKKFYMAHGDGIPPMKKSFRFIRGLFRNRLCQIMFSAVHPRWTVPLAHHWSSSSREGNTGKDCGCVFDPTDDNYIKFAENYLATEGHIDFFVFGHKHQFVDMPVGEDSKLIVLGDWVRWMSYGVFDGNDVKLHLYRPE